jgi:UDP-2-acetamido-3-amino-2,3-dideoxy-glucuronate N-acetyltransferase
MDSKKVCVVGAGYWGTNHIRTLDKMNALGGIVESNSEKLKPLSEQYPDISIYQDLDDAINNDEIAGFSITTPAETHFKLAKKIIEAKKHVLVEKPFTLTIEHAETLVKLKDKNLVNLMVGHILLFHPAVNKIKELILEGKIGKLQYIYSNRLNLGQVRSEENVFWSLAPHDVSILQYFTESYPKSIKAHGSIFLQEGIHDSTVTILEYPTGVNGHIFVSWLHPFKEHRLVIIGSEGMISFEDSTPGMPIKYYDKKFEINEMALNKIDGPIELIKYDQEKPLTKELKYFINHLDGSELKLANGRHALEVTKILVKASNEL